MTTANAIQEAGFVVDPHRWGRAFAASRGVALEDTKLNAAGDSNPDCLADLNPDCLSDWNPDCLSVPDE